MSNVDMYKAKLVYRTLLEALDTMGWTYDEHEEDLCITSGVKTKDIPVDFVFAVRPNQEIVQFISVLPFTMPEDKIVEGAIAICAANYWIINGNFDYSLDDGKISFRMTSSYHECDISEELFKYMICVSANTIDSYNDTFALLAQNKISLDRALELIQSVT